MRSLGLEPLYQNKLKSLALHLKVISSFHQLKTPLNTCWNLVMVCQNIFCFFLPLVRFRYQGRY